MKDSLNIVVAGATGYVGLQLVKILSKHSKEDYATLISEAYELSQKNNSSILLEFRSLAENKNIKLNKFLSNLSKSSLCLFNDFILDSFAGSGTTTSCVVSTDRLRARRRTTPKPLYYYCQELPKATNGTGDEWMSSIIRALQLAL